MEFIKTSIEGVWIIQPKRFGDARGYFSETFRQDLFDEHIGHVDFIQDNESFSTRGVLRGLHYQQGEWSQAKLVRVSQGTVVDVCVDLRSDSPTFGQHVMCEQSHDNRRQVFVPRGFGHGCVVLSDVAQFQYKVDNVYAPQAEATLAWDDPALAIEWPLPADQLLLSEKDRKGRMLKDTYRF